MQWLAAKRTLSELDKRLLQLLEPIVDVESNLRVTRMDFDGRTPADYDVLLDEDRREKGSRR